MCEVAGSALVGLRILATLLENAQVANYLPELLPLAMPWVSSLPQADIPVFAADLARAAASGDHAPERLAACLRDWLATAEIYADPAEAERLRQALQEVDEGRVYQ